MFVKGCIKYCKLSNTVKYYNLEINFNVNNVSKCNLFM